ncbi:hypothetical protein AKJ37_04900 [candidate division MSBL1 archaeon SCGC-AAA259I09]|uniref:Plasmid pRiA4b Orf3-like domain-containing protein n=2 Tax=candidate division MSBL1 TaxID=215777 RepID=A0A133UQS2_9EURY|nr:hypothetical protein AKJ37_04900 [candidate division MSBL1 archaeon SCGC-AAA259I09]KXA97965.1 hypothetical protein AKJ40_05020 [candidate division MSBL1 archaeon SCGC-AAA259M10]
MTAYKFRVKADWKPRDLWRDVVIGEDRTLRDLHEAINPAFGLDFDHLYFFARGQSYWDSEVRYVHRAEIENNPYDAIPEVDIDLRDADETSIHDLGLKVKDRLCYLFDYGDEWRFYMILKEKLEDEPSDKKPEIVKEKGEKIKNQYGPGLPGIGGYKC